jgi:hypothetical protein
MRSLDTIERRNNEPIGAMNNPYVPQSLRRNDRSKFVYEFLGAKAKSTPTLVEQPVISVIIGHYF